MLGSGGGQVVNMLAFTPSIRVRIPRKSKLFETKENKQKDAGVGQIKRTFIFENYSLAIPRLMHFIQVKIFE